MLRAGGAEESELQALLDGTTYGLWPENEPALRLFDLMGTQWRWVGVGQRAWRTGLDYAAVPAATKMAGIRMTPRLFSDLQACESEALSYFAQVAHG